jgi:23S rRNA maturation mini-RNase III
MNEHTKKNQQTLEENLVKPEYRSESAIEGLMGYIRENKRTIEKNEKMIEVTEEALRVLRG